MGGKSLPSVLPQWGAAKSCAESLCNLSNWTLRACGMVHCVSYFLYIWKWCHMVNRSRCSFPGAHFLMTPPGGSLSLHGTWGQCLNAWSLYHVALTCRLNASPSSLMGKTARSSQTRGKVSQVGITERWWSGGLQLSICLGNLEEHLGLLGLPWWLRGKESTCQCRRCEFDPWVGKMPWKRKWQPTPIVLPEKFHGQRSPVGFSPWSCKGVGYDLVANNNNINCDFKWSFFGAD